MDIRQLSAILRRAGASRPEVYRAQRLWTLVWDDAVRAEFSAAVTGATHRDVVVTAMAFVAGHGPREAAAAPEPAEEQAPEPETPVAPGEGSTAPEEDAPGPDGLTPEQIGEILATGATAAAYIEVYPQDASQLLAAEQAGRARKTVLALLARSAEDR